PRRSIGEGGSALSRQKNFRQSSSTEDNEDHQVGVEYSQASSVCYLPFRISPVPSVLAISPSLWYPRYPWFAKSTNLPRNLARDFGQYIGERPEMTSHCGKQGRPKQ